MKPQTRLIFGIYFHLAGTKHGILHQSAGKRRKGTYFISRITWETALAKTNTVKKVGRGFGKK